MCPNKQYPLDSLIVQAGTRTALWNWRGRLAGGYTTHISGVQALLQLEFSGGEQTLQPVKALYDFIWALSPCYHWIFPIFCSNLGFPHSEDLRFQGPFLLSLPAATFPRPYPCLPSATCSHHTLSLGFWLLTALTCIGCRARADGGEEWEKCGNTTSETPPGNISHCLFCSPEEAWLEWERIRRINGFFLSPQYSDHSSELGQLSPLGYLLLKLWAECLHLLT